MFKCKYCQQEFQFETASEKANHTRWCKDNPSRQQYVEKLKYIRSNISEESKLKASEKIKLAHANGVYDYDAITSKKLETRKKNGTLEHTEEAKIKMRDAALKSHHRRLVRSIRDYVKKDGTVVKLDSSWEEALAKRLDDINVDWERPSTPIFYEIDNITKRYFPDFFLPDYDLYLDPKNPIACKVQESKIKILLELMPNLIIIKSLEECETFTPSRLGVRFPPSAP
jgi:hypothetical protein